MTQCETKRKNVHTIWYSLSLELNYELNKCFSVAYIFPPATGNLSDIWREEIIFKSATNLTQIPLFPCWKPQFHFHSTMATHSRGHMVDLIYQKCFTFEISVPSINSEKLSFQPSHSCHYNYTYSTLSLFVSWPVSTCFLYLVI